MSSLTIKAGVLGGTDISQALTEAKELASQLNVAYIQVTFNGIACSIGAGANIENATTDYWEANKPDNPHKFICHP